MLKKEDEIIWSIIHFSDLSLDQFYDIIKLRTAVFVVEQDCPYQEVDEIDRSSFHVMAYLKGELIAVARIIPENLTFSEVSFGRVAVRMGNRGCGLAHMLTFRMISYIQSRLNAASIRISAQTYLISFYRSHGFEIASDEYLEDGIPHIEMLRSSN